VVTTDNSSIKVLIVDDEKKACTNLKNLLLTYTDPALVVVGIANNTKEAEDKIKQLSPDAIFLDIEMPHENAFDFLDRISPLNFEVVFVTAYDEYAVRAFKLSAVDYILKPISIDELRSSVLKLREKLKFKSIMNMPSVYSEVAHVLTNRNKPGKISLKDGNIVEVVDFKDIYFVEAHGSYSRIIFQKNSQVREMMMSSPLSDYEEMLPEEQFYRIHRSFLVNCYYIEKIVSGDVATIITTNGSVLPISRRRYVSLIEYLKSHHYYNE